MLKLSNIATFFVAAAIMPSAAQSKPYVYACAIEESSVASHPFRQANELVFDSESNTVELRAPGAIETREWRFTNREPKAHDEGFTLQRFEDGTIVGGGVSDDTAHSFVLGRHGDLVWTVQNGDGSGEPVSIRWRCEPVNEARR